MSKPREWQINNDFSYEETVDGQPTNGDVIVIEKSAADKLAEALEWGLLPIDERPTNWHAKATRDLKDYRGT